MVGTRRESAPLSPPYKQISTTPAQPPFTHRVARLLALHEELLVAHDRQARVVGLPVRHVGLIVGNADHEAGRARGPGDRAHRPFLEREDAHARPPAAAPANSISTAVTLGVPSARKMPMTP